MPRQCEHWLAMTGLLTVILWMGRNSLEIYLRYHRFPGSFFMFLPPKYKNALVPPMGNKDRKFCGATLFAGINRPLCPVQTHRLPVNAGNASEDTEGTSSFSLPSAAHLLSRFSPRSQPPGLSVDALKALLPLLRFGSNELNTYIQRFCLFVKHFFAPGKDFS